MCCSWVVLCLFLQVPFFKPLLREEKFKDMLSREADFRCNPSHS